MNRRVVVIGIGNEMRGDDAAGILVARRLRELGVLADIRFSDGDGAELIEMWRDADEAILVDAVRSGAPVGTIHRFEAVDERVTAGFRNRPSTHLFGVAEALELASNMLRLPPVCRVFGIEGEQFGVGHPCSEPVSRAVETVAKELAEILERLSD